MNPDLDTMQLLLKNFYVLVLQLIIVKQSHYREYLRMTKSLLFLDISLSLRSGKADVTKRAFQLHFPCVLV